MAENDTDFFKGLLATFTIEAQEHVDALFSGITELEQTSDEEIQATLIEKIFREAHSLKGAARSVKLTRVEAACQTLESTLAAMKRQEIDLIPSFFDNLHKTVCNLNSLLFPEGPTKPPSEKQIKKMTNAAEPVSQTIPRYVAAEEKQVSSATARIATSKLDSILLQTEEMIAMKLLAQQRMLELLEINNLICGWEKDWCAIRDHSADFNLAEAKRPQTISFSERTGTFFKTLKYRLDLLRKSTDQDQRLLGRMVDDLLRDMKSASMLPFSTLTETFPRLIREYAREVGKEIKLDIRGGEIEADRQILEEFKDPLMHVIRNCIDHGIEKPAVRTDRQKPSYGTIAISFKPRDGNRVEIEISDDGAGIDIGKVKATVERLGILSPEQLNKLDQWQALELIYRSGVSTSPIITEISGRGLGLAIVQEKVDKIGGSISLETQPGCGSVFRILLPLMFATYRGIVVRVGEQLFVLPAASAEQTLRINATEVLTVENRETIHLNGTTLSLVRLGDALSIPHRDATTRSQFQAIVMSASRKRIAFVVDEVLDEQEVLVKGLGKQLARVRNIAGASILGSGKVVPVLNVSDLMKSAVSVTTARPEQLTVQENQRPLKKSVLVVEDSITARNLLKGILESAGYQVVTAIDGIDGLTQLRSGEFDLVVSDVEMPRMNGFELTAKIRSEKKFAELPVVLVTALATREDREHGIDVGANAYIVKSSFEQSNLLEIAQRLV